MHGLINKSIEAFLKTTYGEDVWDGIALSAGCSVEGFESMSVYQDKVTDDMLRAASTRLERDEDAVIEDIGTFLVSHPDLEPVRRLMRFGGPTFRDFLLSLDELHDRARMAVPDLELPVISLQDTGSGNHLIRTTWRRSGASALLTGLLNAMAGDYGALVVLERGAVRPSPDGVDETLAVFVAEHDFSEGRSFMLGSGAT